MRIRSLTVIGLALLAFSSIAPAAKKPPLPAPAPLPPQIASAKTAFLSNSCEEPYETCAAVYNALYQGLKEQGRYQLTATPSEAEVVFVIHYVTRAVDRVANGHSVGDIDYSRVKLTLVDRATGVVLWSISEYGDHPQGSVTAILADLKVIATPGATAGPAQRVPGYSDAKRKY